MVTNRGNGGSNNAVNNAVRMHQLNSPILSMFLGNEAAENYARSIWERSVGSSIAPISAVAALLGVRIYPGNEASGPGHAVFMAVTLGTPAMTTNPNPRSDIMPFGRNVSTGQFRTFTQPWVEERGEQIAVASHALEVLGDTENWAENGVTHWELRTEQKYGDDAYEAEAEVEDNVRFMLDNIIDRTMPVKNREFQRAYTLKSLHLARIHAGWSQPQVDPDGAITLLATERVYSIEALRIVEKGDEYAVCETATRFDIDPKQSAVSDRPKGIARF